MEVHFLWSFYLDVDTLKKPPALKILLMFIESIQHFQRVVATGKFVILTLTPIFFLQAVAFLSHLQEEATHLFLVFCHLYVWKEIWPSKWWPSSLLEELTLAPSTLSPPHFTVPGFVTSFLCCQPTTCWQGFLVLGHSSCPTLCFCCPPYTWLSSFSSPFSDILVSSVHRTRIVPGSWLVPVCTVGFWVTAATSSSGKCFLLTLFIYSS